MNRILNLLLICALACGCKKNQSNGPISQTGAISNNVASMDTSEYREEIDELEDCIFNIEKQNDDFLKSIPEFSNYTWNDSTKMATIILKNGNLIYVTRGGCYHYSVIGKIEYTNTTSEIDDLENWFKECRWISKRIMSDLNYETLTANITKKEYELNIAEYKLNVHFTNHNNSEWYLEVKKSKEEHRVTMETGYYFD